jgi:hypothetical protein
MRLKVRFQFLARDSCFYILGISQKLGLIVCFPLLLLLCQLLHVHVVNMVDAQSQYYRGDQ